MYTAKLSQNLADGTPVYEFYSEYETTDSNGNVVTMLQKEDEKTVKELQDRIAEAQARLDAIALLPAQEEVIDPFIEGMLPEPLN